mmetsp:Transcript_119544/g.234983  ORF Transcript_119544/g.234983 Transcript_119544/m.234983 type:complete len:538 (-) Transcript_119544:234-1847(-)|eukprot:CAMPEP_0170232560 /NCGR_PEP_ID=MMETSP0116_2-20130129/16021_1 /TAXON_ID=400756 /ORGANISM="Durinskia baltica, Strain CSIRO CS-38" /LENGTH=537 /DNA_ID=CAMNT_0010483345 /DNA_START=82 /DNA_END=1695 /DNA_ORIENTATION=-
MAGEDAGGAVAAITWAVLSAVLKIAMLVLVGVKLEHQGVLNAAKRKALSALAMDVCLPCLLFADVLPDANLKLLEEGWELLLWPLIYGAVGAASGLALCALAGTPSQHWGAAAACAAFPNANGFPVSIIKALGSALPRSPSGFSAMTFLAIVQLTDGMVKYTIGPIVFRRDARAVRRARIRRGEDHEGDLPLGASLRSVGSPSTEGRPIDGHGGLSAALRCDSYRIQEGEVLGDVPVPPKQGSVRQRSFDGEGLTEFGLRVKQCKCVQPDWSRLDSGRLVWSGEVLDLDPDHGQDNLHWPLLDADSLADKQKQNRSILLLATELGRRLRSSGSTWFDCVRELFPPQVVAVLLALALGLGPAWLKHSFYDPKLVAEGTQPILGWVYGTARELGGGFVPLQMISLGGRMLKVVGPSGPLAATGEAGPRGRERLLRIAASVGVARMFVAPFVLYCLALKLDAVWLRGARPMAFWAPALIVAAMPTANNMSTMADLIGSGRSISAASTAMQLVSSPVVLAATLTALLAGAKYHLAVDVGDD